MNVLYVVRVPTLDGYVPPEGYKVVRHRKLEDGLIEVELEPE